jgi:ubiquitin conjugation factor E4 B
MWKIRAKRLAKLGGSAGSNTPPPAQTPADSSNQAPVASSANDGAADKPATPPIDRSKLLSQLEAQKESPTPAEKKTEAPKITVKPRPASPSKRERDGSERPQSRPRERPQETLEVWQDKSLRQIFRVTLTVEEIKDSFGSKLAFLASTRDELEQANQPLLLNVEMGDAILTEAAQTTGGKVFEYFLQCFKRAVRTIRGMKSTGTEDPKLEILKEARRMCMSYCVFAVTMPEMFGDDVPVTNALVEHLLADPDSDIGICTDFLTEASMRFEEDDSIKDTIVNAAEELSTQLAQRDMLADYQNYVRALRNLLRFPKIVDAVTQSPMWAPPDVEAQDIERRTILGPFFRLSPMQQEAANSYFSSPRSRDRAFITNAQNAIRITLKTHQEQLFSIVDGIVRGGPATRERMLNWFALTVNKNHKKRAMRVDYKTVSSDGFMVNVTNVLDLLCSPFMDAKFGKIEKIDVDYLRRNPRVDISDETKINADQKMSDDFYSQKAEGTNNFISEIFFLTVVAHHYGTEAAQTRITTMRKSVKRYQQDLEAFEAERHKYINVSCRCCIGKS